MSTTSKPGPRFFIDAQSIDLVGGRALCRDERLSHQVRNVLRLKEGEAVQLLDGLGNIWAGRLVKADRTYIEFSLDCGPDASASIENPKQSTDQTRFRLICCLPLIKAHRFEWALEKLCELGAYKILPFQSERCVVRLKANEDGRSKRWQAICKEASEQCERLMLPEIFEPLALADLLKTFAPTGGENSQAPLLPLLLSERNEMAPDMVSTLYNHKVVDGPLDVLILAGPEGGFTDSEHALIAEHHLIKVSLGETILRSETACVSAAAVVSAMNVSKH